MEILGYMAALAIGILLGLIGGGGSILTLPVLVYLLGFNPVISTAYSLFIVGFTSLVGSYKFYRKGLVNLRTAVMFGLPSVLAVYITRRYILPTIPVNLFSMGDIEITKGVMLMLLFGVLMIFAAIGMIRNGKMGNALLGKNVKRSTDAALEGDSTQDRTLKLTSGGILGEGLLVGLLTGLVGAGGGFLVIPALVLLSKLDMKVAVGTSLLIIAGKSLLGFIGDIYNLEINWIFLLAFSSVSTIGIFAGSYLSAKINGDKLRIIFGWFVLVMGFYIVATELLFR